MPGTRRIEHGTPKKKRSRGTAFSLRCLVLTALNLFRTQSFFSKVFGESASIDAWSFVAVVEPVAERDFLFGQGLLFHHILASDLQVSVVLHTGPRRD